MEEKEKFDPTKYKNDFAKTNYEQIILRVFKGKKALLQKVAEEQNMSINQMIINALEIVYRIDLSKDAPDDQ